MYHVCWTMLQKSFSRIVVGYIVYSTTSVCAKQTSLGFGCPASLVSHAKSTIKDVANKDCRRPLSCTLILRFSLVWTRRSVTHLKWHVISGWFYFSWCKNRPWWLQILLRFSLVQTANSLCNKLVYGLVTFFTRRGRGGVAFVLFGISSASFERIQP